MIDRLAAVLFALLFATGSTGQTDETAPLRVGTKHAPPFSIRADDGSWSGIAIELWNEVAAATGYRFEYVERDLGGLLAGLRDRELDLVAAAITTTAEREATIDFSHAFHASGLGIALVEDAGGGFFAALLGFPFLEFLQVLGALLLVLGVSGFLVWLFERRANPGQFEPGPKGLGSGLWWSAVTMTTVGYGDKAPVTLGGRLVALVWMFVSLSMIATFTAAMASTMTTAKLDSSIRGPEDLPHVRVGTLSESTSASYLTKRGIRHRDYPNLDVAIAALGEGEIQALVYDLPILRYLATNGDSRMTVLSRSFAPQQYALALPENSPLRESLNRAMLEILDRDTWRQRLTRYLGDG